MGEKKLLALTNHEHALVTGVAYSLVSVKKSDCALCFCATVFVVC